MAGRQIAIEVEGVRDLVRALSKARGPETRKAFGAANKRIGQSIIDRARPIAPFDSSDSEHLRDSMRAAATADRVLIRAGGKRKAPYAPIVHWGSTYRPEANPFLAKTVESMADRITKDYLAAIDKVARTASA